MTEISGGVCAPTGFLAGGIRCGIKPSSQKKDLALIYSNNLCSAAAMFTTNKVKAASVQVSMENITDGNLRAVIINSGNANACTGKQGLANAKAMVKAAADAVLVSPLDVAVASTGVIGVQLPVNLIVENIDLLKASLKDAKNGGNADALEAIMTTDTRNKEIAVEIEINNKPVRLGAMIKGSGMIHPNMATMLGFITTDISIIPSALDAALRRAVKKSFNRLTVDGDTSTNDMILIMANAQAYNQALTEDSQDFETFCAALDYICISLTKMLARDGEGATKLVTVTVSGAKSEEDAEVFAKSVASSSLVKAACFGADANWGRVLCAMGYSGVEDFDPANVDVSFKSKNGLIQVCKDGETVPFNEETAKKILLQEEIEILIDIKTGDSTASVWGCDLTYDYVKINGDYRS